MIQSVEARPSVAPGVLADLRHRLTVSRARKREALRRLSTAVVGACSDGVDPQTIATSAGWPYSHVINLRVSTASEDDFVFLSNDEHLELITAAREHVNEMDRTNTELELELRHAVVEALHAGQLDVHAISKLAGMSLCRARALFQWHGQNQ